GIDGHHLGAAAAAGIEAGHGEIGGAGENQPQAGATHAGTVQAGTIQALAACLRAFSSRFSSMPRFSADRWSTNTLPSRWSISCWMQTASGPSASTTNSLPAASCAFTFTFSARVTSAY